LRGVHLVAVLRGDARQEAAILRAARGVLGALKAPKAVIWVQDWPVLASGKTDLRRIRVEVGG
jgi:long-chain acyl-CoA synthetase